MGDRSRCSLGRRESESVNANKRESVDVSEIIVLASIFLVPLETGRASFFYLV